MITPVTATLDAAAAMVDRIDVELAAAVGLRDQALALVADNDWCMKALGRRGIVVSAP